MLYLAKDILDGWDAYAGWERIPKDRLYGELERVHVKLAAHSFTLKIFAKGI